jgi:hypothetical protein
MTGTHTFACWINIADSVTAKYCIYLAKSNSDYLVATTGYNNGRLLVSGSPYAESSKMTAVLGKNRWYHIVIVKVGKAVKNIYINGNDGTVSSPDYLGVSALSNLIGAGWASPGPHTYYFNGLMDEIQIWTRALTQPEIQRVMMGLTP